ncbi:MAG: GntP family permease [Bacteroidales bacterium]|nr:GntP family permease [Candidatus Egerieousia equi]
MSGYLLLIYFLVAIALIIVAGARWKIHPFLVLIGVSMLLALACGISPERLPAVIGTGFSSIFASIGLVIIFGTAIGMILEKSGGAVKLADIVLKAVGRRHPQLAMLLLGWILSIPVFCDSGFVIVNPIRKWMARRSGVSPVTLAVALAGGLYISHVLIPPTPGPIAAAGMLGLEDNLLLVIGLGVLCSIFPLAVCYFWANHIGPKIKLEEEVQGKNGCEQTDESASELFRKSIAVEKLPGGWMSALPLIVPILLMGVSSVLSMTGSKVSWAIFLGKPVIALIIGFLCALPLIRRNMINEVMGQTLTTAGPIIFITAAGGILGQVIMETGFVDFVKENASSLSGIGIFFPFLIAAILKTSQGSSTVAITTTAGIMGAFSSSESLMSVLGLCSPLAAGLTVMAIGSGAMMASHANDSYFWVVTNFSGMKLEQGYRTHTMMTILISIAAMLEIWLLYMLLC